MTPEAIQDGVTYTVTLLKVVERGHRKYLPRAQNRFKGRVLKEIAGTYGWEVFGDIQPA